MRRSMGSDDKLYRGKAVVRVPATKSRYGREVGGKPRSFEVSVGPYSTIGAAKSSLTQEINLKTRYLAYGFELDGEVEIERWIEQAETAWIRLP